MSIKIEFDNIFSAWEHNESSSDIYHMILYWMNKYKHNIKSKDEIEDIYERMNNDVSTNDIVEDFIYGKYSKLREEFKHFI